LSEKTFAELLEDATESARRMDAPLSIRLKAVADEVRRVSPEFAGVVDRMVDRLIHNGAGLTAPKPGDLMPDFLLPNESGTLVSLSELLEKGPAVVSFNRGHWCPYCRLNVDALAKAEGEMAKLGAQVVVISPEMTKWGGELKDYAKAPFHVLSDVDGGYALALNLLFWVGDEKAQAMSAGGFDITQFQGNDTWMLPIPATFVIRQDGVVTARYIDPDYRRRMEIEDLVTALRETVSGQPPSDA
jgi:peroxiredoxin